APDPGGADTDGDGVSDALEIAFGSDPSDPLSVPGSASAAVPALQALGLTCLAALLVLSTTRLARRRQQNRSRR
ncbi:MAG: thrombospondin type 3 repeat-containing protein, partial [Myxococcota bacterium]|nr:thrombospondin type 3 repeat-containing protein [Myxococcota bacterium]